MPQLLLQGFPQGAIRIGSSLSVLRKEGLVTYFLGCDNFFSHPESDKAGQRFAIATLIANGHVKAVEVERSSLGIAHRSLMNWTRQLSERGAVSFYAPRAVRGAGVLHSELIAECEHMLAEGVTIPATARKLGLNESTLRKAIKAGRVERDGACRGRFVERGTTKSERSRADADAADGIGTACTRADERMAAAIGLVDCAGTRFEACSDVTFGGLLTGLPMLCGNGLLSGLGKHIGLPKGFYSAMHILIVLGFMALARIRRPEGLRHVPSGEMGKVIGLDRSPEVRTLRAKITLMAHNGKPQAWMHDLSKAWMQADADEAGYLYVDGHVRVYHGASARLPRRFVSREKLCLRGTTDYWVNDALGRPFFVVSKAVTDGLGATLLEQIVPELIKSVPAQPSDEDLAADEMLHRFVVVFDREGANHSLLSKLWEQRIGAITYRKDVKDQWPTGAFSDVDVPVPGGGSTRMKLAQRETSLSAGNHTIPVLEVRRLAETGHQTAIITTARLLESPHIAGRMFSRWCQENFFGYMMEHYDIDGLVEYGSDEIPGTTTVINPTWRALEKSVRELRRRIRKLYALQGEASVKDDGRHIQEQAERLEDIQRLENEAEQLRITKRKTEKKVTIDSLPESDRPTQLAPLNKVLTDTVKMIAYRAETALVGLLRPHLAKEEEARALIRELLVSSADLQPDEQAGTLTVLIHRMTCPAHDKAIQNLLDQLTQSQSVHPQTGMRLIYTLV